MHDPQSLPILLTQSPTPQVEPFRSAVLVEHTGEYGDVIAGCPQYRRQGMAVR